MKKTLMSLILSTMLLAMFAITTFASSDRLCNCGGIIKEEKYYTPWVTKEFIDCIHAVPHGRDARQERYYVVTARCERCHEGTNTQVVQEQYKCLGATSTTKCTNCENGEIVLTEHYTSPWIAVAKTEDGLYTQECIDVALYRCFDCGYNTSDEETLSRTVKLH